MIVGEGPESTAPQKGRQTEGWARFGSPRRRSFELLQVHHNETISWIFLIKSRLSAHPHFSAASLQIEIEV